ncbi:pilus (MSHA type) biogenesis protein MshL [Pseudoalteromonas sp. CO325X]|uniref:pilus (MSHA type) biogenesis protein MshL n=1 Tax=Pseudoalteromonas sp. CO325X TaxID=1777262 RepID=UPI001023CD5A|nr:pilus (MSHA type) biogenesis protein MshL [Pseudoalteromonas sp. CO325X]RZF80966.1 pilus (MSHA type) biogenesis protein MshL [Pseudoalteromonas sp. CO325X]
MKLNNKLLVHWFIVGTSSLLVSACATFGTGERVQPHIAKELEPAKQSKVSEAPQPPKDFEQELLSSVSAHTKVQPSTAIERFDVVANEVALRPFFNALVDDTPFSVAIHPEVSGAISLNLKQVSMDEVLKIITRMYPLDVFLEGQVVQVLPAKMRTESIAVNYLMMRRFGVSNVSVISGGVSDYDQNNNGNSGNGNNNFSGNNGGNNNAINNNNGNNSGSGNIQQLNGSNIQTSSESDFWADLKEALQSLVGTHGGRYVIVSPQASLVTVHALPSEIAAMKEFLRHSEESLQRQVILEARIIEVTLKDEYQQGVNWSEIAANIGSTSLSFSSTAAQLGNQISAELGGAASLVFSNPDFAGVINLLQTQGDVQMLSNPRVTATNNQKAVIKVGEDEYFVTDVSSSEDIGNVTQQNNNDIELTPFFSGIALDVTPQIDKYGSVILHVHPSVTQTEEQTKSIKLGSESIELPLAQSNIRESDTVIRASSGEIVVIGGLMQTITSDEVSKTPVLGDIPLVGNLFKSIRKKQNKKELVILLRPTVVMPDTWKKQQQRSRKLLETWYRN